MKRQNLARVTAVLLIACIIAGSTGCKRPDMDSGPWAPLQRKVNGIYLEANPKLELLMPIWYLALNQGAPLPQLLNSFNSPYMNAVKEHFQPYAEEDAVNLLVECMNGWGDFSMPFNLFLRLTDELAIPADSVSIPEYITAPFAGTDKLERFVAACREFAEKTDFLSFFTEQAPYFEAQFDEGGGFINQEMLTRFEEYYGVENTIFHIVLIPLRVTGGFGVSLEARDGSLHVYSLTAPESANNYFSADGVRELAWHEFGHSFINPLAESNPDLVAAYEPAFRSVYGAMNAIGYGNLPTFINEHIIRAVVARLVLAQMGAEESEAILKKEEESGFAFIRPLYEKLAEYESNRGLWPSIEDFYPELLSAFQM